MVKEQEINDQVKILYFVEDGQTCWSLDLDDVDTCERRGYPYTIVTYVRKEDDQ